MTDAVIAKDAMAKGERRNVADAVSFTLRMSRTLQRQLETAARKNGVSMNLEIVSRLESTLKRKSQMLAPAEAELVEAIRSSVGEQISRMIDELSKKRAND